MFVGLGQFDRFERAKERGFCLVQANAPIPLIQTAFEEAESLWEEGIMAALKMKAQEGDGQELQKWQNARLR